jgi:Undecaprenyl-phosphate glucose phosphotransferase
VRLLPGIVKLTDICCLLLAGFITYYSLVYYSYKTADIYTAAIVANAIMTFCLLYIGGLYNLDVLLRPAANAGAIVLAALTSFALMLAAAFSLQISEQVSRLWVGAFFVSVLASLTISRLVIAVALSQMEARHILARKVVMFGDGDHVRRLRNHIETSKTRFVAMSGSFTGKLLKPDMSVDRAELGRLLRDLTKYLRDETVDDVIIALPWHASQEIRHVVDKLRELPVQVYLGADTAGLEFTLRPPRDALREAAVFEVAGRPLSGWDLVIKTLEDYLLAISLIVLLAPLFLVIAAAIKLDSPGPVLFRQNRYGFNNETFGIFKFRTMYVDQPEQEKTQQAVPGDSRVTRVGRLLRKSSLDELPQLLNVLGGSMSIVGPRPHAVDHNEDFARKIRGYFARHRVKPGVTGLAQVKGFRGITDTLDKMENRVKYDIEYTENWSLLLDLKILVKTAIVCLRGHNAY